MFEGCGSRPRPRDRIVETARDLFRRHGLRGVGVDTIAEAAGTNKMTLYRHFGSKDDLIVACLRSFAAEADRMWDDLEAKHPGDSMAQLHAWVPAVNEHAILDWRGCDMANAAVELAQAGHPARHVIEEFKQAHRKRLVALCHAAGIAQPDLLADVLHLLIEGARVNWQAVGPEGPGARFVEIAEALIVSFSAQRVPAPRAGGVALPDPTSPA